MRIKLESDVRKNRSIKPKIRWKAKKLPDAWQGQHQALEVQQALISLTQEIILQKIILFVISKGSCSRAGAFFIFTRTSVTACPISAYSKKERYQTYGGSGALRKGKSGSSYKKTFRMEILCMKIYRNCNGSRGSSRFFPGDSMPPVVIDNTYPSSFYSGCPCPYCFNRSCCCPSCWGMTSCPVPMTTGEGAAQAGRQTCR